MEETTRKWTWGKQKLGNRRREEMAERGTRECEEQCHDCDHTHPNLVKGRVPGGERVISKLGCSICIFWRVAFWIDLNNFLSWWLWTPAKWCIFSWRWAHGQLWGGKTNEMNQVKWGNPGLIQNLHHTHHEQVVNSSSLVLEVASETTQDTMFWKISYD